MSIIIASVPNAFVSRCRRNRAELRERMLKRKEYQAVPFKSGLLTRGCNEPNPERVSRLRFILLRFFSRSFFILSAFCVCLNPLSLNDKKHGFCRLSCVLWAEENEALYTQMNEIDVTSGCADDNASEREGARLRRADTSKNERKQMYRSFVCARALLYILLFKHAR